MDLRNTNSYRGSLHCMTTDLPFGLENLVFEEDFDKLLCPFEIPLLDLNGRYVKADSMNIYQN